MVLAQNKVQGFLSHPAQAEPPVEAAPCDIGVERGSLVGDEARERGRGRGKGILIFS